MIKKQRIASLKNRITNISDRIDKYSEDQERDDHGRWTAGDRVTVSSESRLKDNPKLKDNVGTVVRQTVPGGFAYEVRFDKPFGTYGGNNDVVHQDDLKLHTPSPFEFKRTVDAQGKPTTGAMGRKWDLYHKPTGKPVGDLSFKSRKEGAQFIANNLQSEHPGWQKEMTPEMHSIYNAARAKLYNIR